MADQAGGVDGGRLPILVFSGSVGSVDEVRSEVSWPLRVKEPLASTVVPDANALRLLREELDPKSIYLGG